MKGETQMVYTKEDHENYRRKVEAEAAKKGEARRLSWEKPGPYILPRGARMMASKGFKGFRPRS
jgi:hypothetical protein